MNRLTRITDSSLRASNARNFHMFHSQCKSGLRILGSSRKLAPLLRNASTAIKSKVEENDEIVISGISGRFPQSKSIDEFKENLLNGVDMISDQTRFKIGKPIPTRYGFLSNLDKFDADFFGVSYKLAPVMDPALRKLLEVSFETIIDAGINPATLRGTQTAVFVGTDGGDPNSYWTLKHGREELCGYAEIGTPICLQANQVSHLLDLKGTSLTISTACSSSLFTLETAVNSILSGKCDRAIVGATCLHLCSHHSDNFSAIGASSLTGISRPFDNEANGFVRSEAVVSLLLERKSVAKRNYATVKYIRASSDGTKKQGIFNPSGACQEALYRQVYEEAGIDPGSIFYVEAHGTGTPAGDPEELTGVSKVFCKAESRTKPLLIGSVKSNMGHSEAAAGLCGIAKVLIAGQAGVIPANLNFRVPNERAAHLFDGSMEVVTENVPLDGQLIGVSSFGIGGTNSHLILELNHTKALPADAADLPILVPFSGQTEEFTKSSLDTACARATDPQFNGLLHQVFKQRVSGHGYRGYGILQTNSEGSHVVSSMRAGKLDSSDIRPIWFVFPGMGSQWQEMGRELMKIDVFHDSIQKSRATLKNAGVDLDMLLAPNNTSIFENIRDAFNSIAAMQIALHDTLISLDIHPDGLIGHSFGEHNCAYADGCISAEESLLISDARGRACEETRKLDAPGGMAAVGLSWADVKARCPDGIVAACHNGPQSATISGSLSAVKDFVKQLQGEGVFAKEVNSCQIAAHSPFTLASSNICLKYMEDSYQGQGQRMRSKRWVSTSVPESEWHTPEAKMATAGYFTNNFVKPVLFHEAVQHIPSNAVVIEIAPKGLFQAILKSSLPSTCTLFAPMQQKPSDRLLHFVSSVGDLYNAGVNVDMAALYPPVNFPVPAQTPSISPLIRWNHDLSWTVPILENTDKYIEGMMNIDLQDSMYKYLEGHKLDDRLVFPGTGYLHFAWKSYAESLGVVHTSLPVTFENVSFDRAVFLNQDKPTQLRFSLQRGSGIFEIIENDVTVTRGRIFSSDNTTRQLFNSESVLENISSTEHFLRKKDIYKEFKIRGYNFQGEFQSIKRIDLEGNWAEVSWNGNWTTLLDSIIQASFLKTSLSRSTAVPVRMGSLSIDPKTFLDYVSTSTTDTIPVINKSRTSKTLAPGIEMTRVKANVIQRKNQKGNLSISQYVFTPYFENPIPKNPNNNPPIINSQATTKADWEQKSLTIFMNIFLENFDKKKVKIGETFTKHENYIRPVITQILAGQPMHEAVLTTISTESEISKLKQGSEADASSDMAKFENILSKTSTEELAGENKQSDLVILDDLGLLKSVAATVGENSWIILRENQANASAKFKEAGLHTVAHRSFENNHILLLRKIPPSSSAPSVSSVSIDSKEYDWLPKLKSLMAVDDASNISSNSRIYVTSQNNPTSGIVGLVNCLRREPGGDSIRCLFDPQGKLTLDFEKPGAVLSDIISKDLAINIYQNGGFGSYRHIPLESDSLTKPTKEVEHASVYPLTVGDFSSLRWIETPLKYFKENDQDSRELCHVNFASLNFRDIMLASSKLAMSSTYPQNSFETQVGLEFSGRDRKGRRIMGCAVTSLGTKTIADKTSLILDVPDRWSLEEAATVPVVYATAYYALCDRARMSPGGSILIHSGTGGVGQAAINIALSMNCQIFTSVGTNEKRKYIKELFPSLTDDHICNSRDCTFEQQVLEMTDGRGVDIVLNSLAEDKLQASLNCLAIGGTFSEIGKFDILQNSPIGMQHLEKNVDIGGVDLVPLFTNRMPGKDRLKKLLDDGINSGVVKPLVRTVFKKEEIEEAFRYMAAGKHMGKVLVQVQSESTDPTAERCSSKVMAIPRSYFDPKKTYVIIGGLGGLGLEVANWLVERGAQKLILFSRSGVSTGYQKMCLNKWEKLGVHVQTSEVDLTCYDQAKHFIEDNIKNGVHFGGIFNSGLVLQDALIENQTFEMFQAVDAPKVKISENLDTLTRKHCPDLDYFVAFSSLSAGLGNAGQSNYGLANSAMEQICHARTLDGLHGLAIQWGVIGDVGVVAEHMAEDQVFDGMNPQRVSSCLQVLDALLEQSKNQTNVDPQDKISCFSSMIVGDKLGDQKSSRKMDLTEAVSRLFSIKKSTKDIDPSTTMVDLGLDSLSGTELQQLLEREYDCQLSPVKIRTLTWGELKAIQQGSYNSESDGGQDGLKQGKASSGFGDNGKILIKLKSEKLPGAASLFIVHGADGEATPFVSLAAKLPHNVYGFQTGARRFQENVDGPSLQDMAEEYIKEIKLVQPGGPYDIVGYSVGGCLAFQIANQLQRKYQDEVRNLVILDGHCTFGMAKEMGMTRAVESMLKIVENVIKLTDQEKAAYVQNLHPTDAKQNRRLFLQVLNAKFEGQVETATVINMKRSYETMITLAAMANVFKPEKCFKGNVHLIKAQSSVLSTIISSDDYDFQRFCDDRITLTTVQGDHQSFLYPEKVQQTADIIKQILESSWSTDTEDTGKDVLEY